MNMIRPNALVLAHREPFAWIVLLLLQNLQFQFVDPLLGDEVANVESLERVTGRGRVYRALRKCGHCLFHLSSVRGWGIRAF